ncbi:membrane metallo-endopeptidase-like 1 [Dermacentor variabilis]|uniref:membrane metallo-endopeptidase-like 1 n=1 Tax=Dermacentor variabilis TaxID=34621 RepID=UPI003F5AFABA
MWADQMTWFYDETDVTAYYLFKYNKIVITTGLLQPPFFFTEGPPAFNYGSFATLLGHEMMHGYDVSGRQYDDNNQERQWGTREFTTKYAEKAHCLRNSHTAAKRITARQATVNDTLDSENICDLVGTRIGYTAYTSLSGLQRHITLPGLNVTAERLFFISNCIKWCEYKHPQSLRYAPGRSRCIVPLMNMVEFSDAFACARGTPMNPPNKCDFWK